MTEEKKHGGARPGSGRPRLPDKRKRYTFRITPENHAYLKSLPTSAGELINRLLDELRGRK